mgnify:CR=1 FL=1
MKKEDKNILGATHSLSSLFFEQASAQEEIAELAREQVKHYIAGEIAKGDKFTFTERSNPSTRSREVTAKIVVLSVAEYDYLKYCEQELTKYQHWGEAR